MNLMWENLADSDGDNNNTGPSDPNNLGDFASDSYWSSAEHSFLIAWREDFSDGDQLFGSKAGLNHVRAVRDF